MPKFPNFSKRVDKITGSVFEKYAPRMAAQGNSLVRLHLGDTYLPTRFRLPFEADMLVNHPSLNRYCNTFGIDDLRDALVDKIREDNDLQVKRNHVLITVGATNALSISIASLVGPGESVIVLSPAWPFLFGMVKLAGARVIEVPFYMKLIEEPDLNILEYLEQFITAKTAAIYINTPNNPSGKVLSQSQLEQIAELARKHNLWVVSDEAYDGLTYDGLPHISIAGLPGMFNRTLSVFSFSKTLMFAGLRLGYVAGNPDAIVKLNKMMVHQLYSASTCAQQMMVEPVKTRHEWLPEVRAHYQELRDLVIKTLAVEIAKPESAYFAFFPIKEYLHGRKYWQVIDACIDGGVSIAPGDSFGSHYKQYIRICFTGEPPERLKQGIERLNRILSDGGTR